MDDWDKQPEAAVTYSRQYRRCKRSGCSACQDGGPGHGPYWYAFWREDGRPRSRYVGKYLPAGAAVGEDHEAAVVPPSRARRPTSGSSAVARECAAAGGTAGNGLRDTQPRTSPPLRVRTLGAFQVWRGSTPIPAETWKHRKALTLFTCLIGAPGHRLHRERLVDCLWPETGGDRGGENLRLTVFRLRRLLDDRAGGTGYVRVEGECLALSPGWSGEAAPDWLDAESFDRTAAAALAGRDPGACRIALALYQGEYLPGDPYDEWTAERREVLRSRYLAVLLHLAELEGAQGEVGAAAAALHTLLACDPCNEDAASRLMGLLAAAGQRTEALRVFDQLAVALRRDVGVGPSTDVLTLRRRLLAQEAGNGAHVAAPPAASPRRTNLPAALSSFLGRERDIAEVRQRLQGTRLLTLTGVGGCGKTRLALQVSESLVEDFPDGVWLVELAAIGAGAEGRAAVLRAIATALGCREEAGRPLIETVAAYLYARSTLVVLDNCEHLLDACAALVARLLEASKTLTVLATSRERLGVPGERLYMVRPLAVPPLDATVDDLPRYGASALFLARAGDVSGEDLNAPSSVHAIAQICTRLAGIPLALELAAARAATMPLGAIAARLDDCYRLLVGGPRTVLSRHRTLRAALEWSHVLLGPAERIVFRRLAVFSGSWTEEAAELVCSDPRACEDSDSVLSYEIVDILAGLAAKSLIQREGSGCSLRFGMLEPVRQYAAEKLSESGEQQTTRDRHLRWCVAVAEEAAPQLTGPRQTEWIGRLEAEHDNMRAALTWARERGAGAEGLRLTVALGRFWLIGGYFGEGRGWLEWALACGEEASPALRARALDWVGNIAESQGEFGTAVAMWEKGLELDRAQENADGIARGLGNLAYRMAVDRREYARAAALLEESLALARAVEDTHLIATVMTYRGFLEKLQGGYGQATMLLEEGLALYRVLGDKRNVAITVMLLGALQDVQGDYARAECLLEESLALARELGSKPVIADSLRILGLVAYRQAACGRAAALLEESVLLSREIGANDQIADALEGLACVAAGCGESRRAALVGGAAEALREMLGMPMEPSLQGDHDLAVRATRAALGDEVFAATWAHGRATPLDQAITLALKRSCVAG